MNTFVLFVLIAVFVGALLGGSIGIFIGKWNRRKLQDEKEHWQHEYQKLEESIIKLSNQGTWVQATITSIDQSPATVPGFTNYTITAKWQSSQGYEYDFIFPFTVDDNSKSVDKITEYYTVLGTTFAQVRVLVVFGSNPLIYWMERPWVRERQM
jgi:hypothetical protein